MPELLNQIPKSMCEMEENVKFLENEIFNMKKDYEERFNELIIFNQELIALNREFNNRIKKLENDRILDGYVDF